MDTATIVSYGTCPSHGPNERLLQQIILQDIIANIPNPSEKYPTFHKYIKWIEYCVYNKQCIQLEYIQLIEKNHATLLTIHASLGNLGLLKHDYDHLYHLLRSHNGTQDHTKIIRRFCIEFSHSIKCIIHIIYSHIKYCMNSSYSFSKIMDFIYVIDDVLYDSDLATSSGPYTNILLESQVKPINIVNIVWPYLEYIMHAVSVYSNTIEYVDIDECKQSLIRVCEDWGTKDIISQSQEDNLIYAIQTERMQIAEPVLPSILSPCPVFPAHMSACLPPPPAPPLPPGPRKPPLPHQSTSVGKMADILRVELAQGKELYTPISPIVAGTMNNPPYSHIEVSHILHVKTYTILV